MRDGCETKHNRITERFEIHEQTFRIGPEETLAPILVGDKRMLEEGPDLLATEEENYTAQTII